MLALKWTKIPTNNSRHVELYNSAIILETYKWKWCDLGIKQYFECKGIIYWQNKQVCGTSCFPLTKVTVGARLTAADSTWTTSPPPSWTASLVAWERSVIWGKFDWEPRIPPNGWLRISRIWSTTGKQEIDRLSVVANSDYNGSSHHWY